VLVLGVYINIYIQIYVYTYIIHTTQDTPSKDIPTLAWNQARENISPNGKRKI
jgi:hypothetical protein